MDCSRARSRLTRTFVAVFNELADHAVGHCADAPGTRDRQVIDTPVQPESTLSHGAVGVTKIAVRKQDANLGGIALLQASQHGIEVPVPGSDAGQRDVG